MTRMNWKQRAWLALVTVAGLSVLVGVASAQDQAAHDEDAPAISGQAGYSVLCVRNDAGTALAGTTGDYINCTTDANGAIYTTQSSVTPGTGATSLGKAEDAVHTSGDTGVMALGVQTDGSTSLSASGDYSVIGTDAAGNVRAVGSVASGAADSGNPVKVGGKYNSSAVTLTNGQRGDTQLDANGNTWVRIASDTSATFDGATANWWYFSSLTHSAFAPLWTMPSSWNGTTLDQQFNCASQATVSVTAGNTTELVALTASKVIRVCSFVLTESLAGTAQFVYGTGTNCGTGTTNMTGAMAMATSGTLALSAGQGSLLRTASANALCLAAVTGNITGFVTYGKF